MVCRNCMELKARVRALEVELGYRTATARVDRLRRKLGVTRTQANLILQMYRAYPEVAPREAMRRCLPASLDGSIKVLISDARGRISPGQIINIHGGGYRLDTTACGLVRDALGDDESGPGPGLDGHA